MDFLELLNFSKIDKIEKGIKDGTIGAKGDKGDPGEVTTAAMNAAIEEAIDPVTSQLAEIASDVRRIDNALAPVSLNVDSWKSVQQVLRAGLAPKVFPIGTQLLMSHSVYGDRLYDVVAHDYLKSVHDQNAHTMTLLQHDLLPALQFDASEAFYYAEVALPAGKYNFTLATAYGQWAAGTYQFTLANELPVGGQLTINGNAAAAITTRKVYAFSSRTNTTKTEECVITSGSEGTSLGTFGTELNHSQRVSYGSNNYKESAIRQFLNSSAAAGSVWTPQTKFDRPPSWVTSLAGFVGGLDAHFLSIIGDVVLPCATNSLYEAPDSTTPVNTKYNLHDKFYLASHNEVFGSQDGVADDSVLLPYYTGAMKADRIKYLNGSAAGWWERTPFGDDAGYVRRVGTDGSVSGDGASVGFIAFAPACTIV